MNIKKANLANDIIGACKYLEGKGYEVVYNLTYCEHSSHAKIIIRECLSQFKEIETVLESDDFEYILSELIELTVDSITNNYTKVRTQGDGTVQLPSGRLDVLSNTFIDEPLLNKIRSKICELLDLLPLPTKIHAKSQAQEEIQ